MVICSKCNSKIEGKIAYRNKKPLCDYCFNYYTESQIKFRKSRGWNE